MRASAATIRCDRIDMNVEIVSVGIRSILDRRTSAG